MPPSLVTKIESRKFVEMADLVPNHLGFEDIVGTKSKQRAVTNIAEWLKAFAVYISVVARKQPKCVPDLMGYQILMLEASNEYHNNRWMAYDQRFQQQAASQPSCKWSSIESILWNFVVTGKAKASHYKHWLSPFHLSKNCEFAPDPTHDTPPNQTPGWHRFVCRQWNEQYTEGCHFLNYWYEHVCYYCAFNPAARDTNH